MSEARVIMEDPELFQSEATVETQFLGDALRELRYALSDTSREMLIWRLGEVGKLTLSSGKAITLPLIVIAEIGRLQTQWIEELIEIVQSLSGEQPETEEAEEI